MRSIGAVNQRPPLNVADVDRELALPVWAARGCAANRSYSRASDSHEPCPSPRSRDLPRLASTDHSKLRAVLGSPERFWRVGASKACSGIPVRSHASLGSSSPPAGKSSVANSSGRHQLAVLAREDQAGQSAQIDQRRSSSRFHRGDLELAASSSLAGARPSRSYAGSVSSSATPVGGGERRSGNYRAGEGIRTLDVNLGKVALYH